MIADSDTDESGIVRMALILVDQRSIGSQAALRNPRRRSLSAAYRRRIKPFITDYRRYFRDVLGNGMGGEKLR